MPATTARSMATPLAKQTVMVRLFPPLLSHASQSWYDLISALMSQKSALAITDCL